MRKVTCALVMGLMVGGCGGGDEAQKPPATPSSPPVAAVDTSSPPAAGTPSSTPAKPKPSPAELQAATLKAMNDARNAHDAKKVASLFAEDAVVSFAGLPDEHGRAEIEKGNQHLFDGYKDSKYWMTRTWTKKDMVAIEWAWSGTNNGEIMGMKPTEKPAGAFGFSVLWFNDDGLVKREDAFMDMATVMAQLTGKGKARAIPTPSSSVEAHTAKDSPDEAKNIDLVKGMYAGLDGKKEADFIGPMADDIEYNDLTAPESMKGKGEAKKFFGMFTKAFPDGKSNVTNVFAAEDFVIAEVNLTGTHKGQFGPFAATKKPVNMHAAEIFQVKDGKVIRGWTFANNAEFLTQIGVIKPPAPPKTGAAPAPAAVGAPGAKPADKTSPTTMDKTSPSVLDKTSPTSADKTSPTGADKTSPTNVKK